MNCGKSSGEAGETLGKHLQLGTFGLGALGVGLVTLNTSWAIVANLLAARQVQGSYRKFPTNSGKHWANPAGKIKETFAGALINVL